MKNILQISLQEIISAFELVEIPSENDKTSTGTISNQIFSFASKSPILKITYLVYWECIQDVTHILGWLNIQQIVTSGTQGILSSKLEINTLFPPIIIQSPLPPTLFFFLISAMALTLLRNTFKKTGFKLNKMENSPYFSRKTRSFSQTSGLCTHHKQWPTSFQWPWLCTE